VRPHSDQVSANFRIERLMARLTSGYGLLALLLAAVGLYGVTAFAVTQQTREIGVRMALGADRRRVIRAVVQGPVRESMVGLLIGAPLALAGSRVLAAQLYGVEITDPSIFGMTALVLLVSTAAAALVPALRAASIDPTAALRSE
jgi:ABC-type antimicrobial peptide transport system permease subunit